MLSKDDFLDDFLDDGDDHRHQIRRVRTARSYSGKTPLPAARVRA